MKIRMHFFGLHFLLIGFLLQYATSNVNLSKRTKVITKGELPCVGSEIGEMTYIAGVTKPIELEISLAINVEEVISMSKPWSYQVLVLTLLQSVANNP